MLAAGGLGKAVGRVVDERLGWVSVGVVEEDPLLGQAKDAGDVAGGVVVIAQILDRTQGRIIVWALGVDAGDAERVRVVL